MRGRGSSHRRSRRLGALGRGVDPRGAARRPHSEAKSLNGSGSMASTFSRVARPASPCSRRPWKARLSLIRTTHVKGWQSSGRRSSSRISSQGRAPLPAGERARPGSRRHFRSVGHGAGPDRGEGGRGGRVRPAERQSTERASSCHRACPNRHRQRPRGWTSAPYLAIGACSSTASLG